eukprot:Nk52_evm69s62 gene=Nk52_evmTU69s62
MSFLGDDKGGGFKFNFGFDDGKGEGLGQKKEGKREEEEGALRQVVESVVSENGVTGSVERVKVTGLRDVVQMWRRDISNVEVLLAETGKDKEDGDVAKAVQHNSDLIPGVYEGGMKTWECSLDLVRFCASHMDFKGLRVIELGCGSALPGIYAAMNSAKCVYFQDYNVEVIQNITIPNAQMNLTELQLSQCRFFSGDWGTLAENVLTGGKFDVILTSETIYSSKSQSRLYGVISQILNPEGGVVFVGAKTYYFGVGGGTRQFEDLIKEHDEMDVKCVDKIDGGVQREILEMKFQKKK